jgi:hypothetical protein
VFEWFILHGGQRVQAKKKKMKGDKEANRRELDRKTNQKN